jgi:hypothetical protein
LLASFVRKKYFRFGGYIGRVRTDRRDLNPAPRDSRGGNKQISENRKAGSLRA